MRALTTLAAFISATIPAAAQETTSLLCSLGIGASCSGNTGTLALGGVALVGLPARRMLKRYIRGRMKTDPTYVPAPWLVFVSTNLRRLSLLALAGAGALLAMGK